MGALASDECSSTGTSRLSSDGETGSELEHATTTTTTNCEGQVTILNKHSDSDRVTAKRQRIHKKVKIPTARHVIRGICHRVSELEEDKRLSTEKLQWAKQQMYALWKEVHQLRDEASRVINENQRLQETVGELSWAFVAAEKTAIELNELKAQQGQA